MKNNNSQKPLPKLSKEEWRNLWNLVRLAIRREYGELPKKIKGVDVEAEIFAAIEEAFFDRQRDPSADSEGNEITFYTFICRIVDSKIGQILAREKMRPYIANEKK